MATPIKMCGAIVWQLSRLQIILFNMPYSIMAKHVEMDRHFIKEKIGAKVIDLAYISSGKQVADVMTKKPIVRNKFDEFRSGIY